MTDDMHRYMTELGSSVTPEPDPRFVTNLELQLRESRAGATAGRFARPRRWPATVAAVTFSVAVVAFGLATVDTSPQVVSISAASGAEVRMPDGQVVVATPGLELPNGAVVEVGPAGSARIGDIDVGPLEAAEITAEGVIVAREDTDGLVRLSTTAVGSQVSAISTPVTVDGPMSAPTSPDAGGTGTLGSSSNGEGSSSTSEPVTSTTDLATTSSAPDSSAVDIEPTAPTSTSSLPISATSIVRTTNTTAPTSTTSESPTTSTSSSSTTAVSSTTLVLASTTTSSTTSEAPNGSTTTTTDYEDHPTTTTSNPPTTQPGSTSTTTTVDTTSSTSTTSTTTAVDPTFLKLIGELRFELASCRVDTTTLVSLVYAIATDSVSPGQSNLLKSCLG